VKKILLLFLMCALLLFMVGCSGESVSLDDGFNAVLSDQEPAVKSYKIALVSVTGADMLEDLTNACYRGILSFEASRGNIDSVTTLSTDSVGAYSLVETNISQYDIFILPGDSFNDISTLAASYPNKLFVIVDPADSGKVNLQTASNICVLNFLEEQCGFLAGMIAALESESGQVSVISGVLTESAVNYQLGFEAGVLFANMYYGTSAAFLKHTSFAGLDEFGASYGGNFVGTDDVDAFYNLCKNLNATGADVIFSTSDAGNTGVIAAAKENNFLMICSDFDRFDEGINGEENVILTSVVKNIPSTLQTILSDYADDAAVGGMHHLGFGDSAVGYVSKDNRQQLSAETMKILDENLYLLQEGSIIPPSLWNDYAPDNFPGL